MGSSNRCPECGGVANHILTDVEGRTYYQCSTNLTTFKQKDGKIAGSKSRLKPCETILDQTGKKFTGTIAYRREDEIKTVGVTDGKERR